MTAPDRRLPKEYRRGLFLLLPILIVVALLVFLPPDGRERAEWMQFIGRFHPLVVHFPIALVLLVPIFHLVGRRPQFSYLRASCGFLLGLATFAATAAATLGWCLGRSGGLFWPSRYTAHVGRRSAHTHLLAVLGVRAKAQPVRSTVRNSTGDSGCAGRVDGIPRWTIVAWR